MSTSKFASSFAPYTLPPDDPSFENETTGHSWFTAHQSSQGINASYQSGGIPSFSTTDSSATSALEEAEASQNQWETTYGLRVDLLAAVAYLLGPISALALLILETHNDFVRFHAYQSALLTTPLAFLRIFAALVHFPSWMQTFCTLMLVIPSLFMTFRTYRDVSQGDLVPYQLPVLGPIANQWVEAE